MMLYRPFPEEVVVTLTATLSVAVVVRITHGNTSSFSQLVMQWPRATRSWVRVVAG